MMRAIVFIDGFNLYHAIQDQIRSGRNEYRKYKWMNFWNLGEQYVEENETLVAAYWFTAYISWKSASANTKKERHRKLVAVSKDLGVEVVWGKFRPVTRTCRARCGKEYQTHEEKRTDVKIALQIYELARIGAFDKAIVISGDSDLVPAIEMSTALNPSLQFLNIVPIGRTSAELSRAPNTKQEKMAVQDLIASRLPNVVQLQGGGQINCPNEWA